jgi:hypothetical protein
MGRLKKLTVYFISILLITLTLAPTAFANSAEPPNLTVIVSFPDNDLTLSIRFADGNITDAVQLQKEQKAWEAYYRFYGMGASTGPSLEGATLIVHSSQKSFECSLPSSALSQYNNLITLNIENESIIEGQPLARSMLLVSMRVILTLLIEGLIFFAFEYRKKTSWIVFVVINLLTQGALNIALNGPNLGSYWIFGFALYEIIIFIVEAVAFALILKEYKKSRAIIYTLAANLASLILGGALISYLPV